MLPHNSLGRSMARKLKVYAGPEHPHHGAAAAAVRDHPGRPVSIPDPAADHPVRHRHGQHLAR